MTRGRMRRDVLPVVPPARYADHVSLAEDLRDEGEPEQEFNPGIASRLPRKRIAAGALIRASTASSCSSSRTIAPGSISPAALLRTMSHRLPGHPEPLRDVQHRYAGLDVQHCLVPLLHEAALHQHVPEDLA